MTAKFMRVVSTNKGLTIEQKDKAALERIQRKAARFVTGNYDRTANVTEKLQDLQWDTLETMRRHTRLSTVYKMCRWGLGGLFESKQRKEDSGKP